MSVGVIVAGLAYQRLSQWMVDGNQVVVACVQPFKVFQLGSTRQLIPIAGLTSQY